jgi:hypothetical protein
MLDLFSEDMRRNPYPTYDRLRGGLPVFHLAPFDLWIILDFEGVKRALVDHDTFSSDLSYVPGSGSPGEWVIFFDLPRHTKLRKRRAVGAAQGASRARPIAAANPLHAGPARRGLDLTEAFLGRRTLLFSESKLA